LVLRDEIEDDDDQDPDAIETNAGPTWLDPAYNGRGNVTEGPRPGDEATAAKRQFYVYDAWDRLVKVTDNCDNTIAEYRYDGLHSRIRKFLPDGDDWTVKEYYYNLGWQVLEVRKEDEKARTGTPIPEPSLAAHWYERYTWSPRYIDALIARQRDADGDAQHTLEEALIYTHDANMNVTARSRRTSPSRRKLQKPSSRSATKSLRPPRATVLLRPLQFG
jgi:YD repeat-containing protein